MLKNGLVRGINSFVYSIGIFLVLQFMITIVIDKITGRAEFIPVLPEFAAHFANPYVAVYVQTILIGLTSAVFGAGSIIMEIERLSLLFQSLLYFVVTMFVWIPVGCFCWGLHKYPGTMISVSISYLIAYIISWGIQYRQCKKNVDEINQKLLQLREEEDYELCN